MALVVHQDQLFFTREEKHPVGTLLEAIWKQYPDRARAITRNRIYTDQLLNILCSGMLKVAGKRCTVMNSPDYQALFKDLQNGKQLVEVYPVERTLRCLPFKIEDKKFSKEEAINVATQIASLSKLKIGAVLLDREQRIVSWGWNDHFPNKIIHAEIMLVKNFQVLSGQEKIPLGFTVVTTLQPCVMCAGYVFEHCEDSEKIKIIFKEVDLGPFAYKKLC